MCKELLGYEQYHINDPLGFNVVLSDLCMEVDV